MSPSPLVRLLLLTVHYILKSSGSNMVVSRVRTLGVLGAKGLKMYFLHIPLNLNSPFAYLQVYSSPFAVRCLQYRQQSDSLNFLLLNIDIFPVLPPFGLLGTGEFLLHLRSLLGTGEFLLHLAPCWGRVNFCCTSLLVGDGSIFVAPSDYKNVPVPLVLSIAVFRF